MRKRLAEHPFPCKHAYVGTTLHGTLVTLRPATADDTPALSAIRGTPEVYARWRGGDDLADEVASDLDDPDTEIFAIELGGRVVGAIQWYAENDDEYRHAGLDIYLDPACHGRGVGTDAVRVLARHLIDRHHYHRLIIDPAADNAAAIRCYEKVGFRPVGTMRQYERGLDGTWHDALLMDLLAAELVRGG
ncbi:GNAT family N-acetyltransferase [Kitasatospora sp. NPDC052868]|uniref:GNAT family N-acetyltransferase n=1 Tax=Kitasatospora sp. NPDC052868 TaxID=3364060 RepID=UPI0037CCA594